MSSGKLVHHRSQPVHDMLAKGLHNVSGTQVDSEQQYQWAVNQSQEAAIDTGSGSILTFLIPATAPGIITVLEDSYVKINAFFELAADVTDATNPKTSCVPALSTALFQDVEMAWAGTVVRPNSGSLTPYSVLFDTLLNENKAWLDNRDYSGGFIFDTPDQGASDDVAVNSGFVEKRVLFLGGAAADSATRPFSMMIPLRSLGIRTADALPPGIEMRLRLTRAADSFLTWGSDSATSLPKLKITQARIYTRQVRLTPEAQAALTTSWMKEEARLNFQRVRMFSQRFPIGTQDIWVNQALPGPRPSRVVVCYISQDNLTGSQEAPAYSIRPELSHVMSDVYLQLGDSRFYPVQAFSMDRSAQTNTTLDLSQMYEMYQSIAQRDAALPSSQLLNMQMLCFATSKSGDPGAGTFDISEETAIDFHARLSGAPAAAYSICIFSFTNGVIEIDHNGAVSVDV